MISMDITPRGPFSLAASTRFLEGFTPASQREAADGVLRMAFPSDDGRWTVAAAVRQEQAADGTAGTVLAEFTLQPVIPPGSSPDHAGASASASAGAGAGPGPDGQGGPGPGEADATPMVRAQIARILSLDVDGEGFPGLADADPVVAGLMAEFPGLRPVCFYSPYEAAAWAVIGQRIRMTQAAALKSRLTREHGPRVRIAGETPHAFPAPQVLRTITRVPGLTGTKVERLHALADAASAGLLDAAHLRAMPAEDALAALRELPGIGPFSAELILIRGAGHPDVFPRHERRLHAAMADAYGLGEDTGGSLRRLAAIADHWSPYRSWIALLLRARAEETNRAGVPSGRPTR